MKLKKRRQILLERHLVYASKYKDFMKYLRSEKNKIRRVIYGLKKFGLPYALYHLSRFNVPGLFGNIRGNLFFGRKMILPASDIGACVLSMYGILQHKSEKKLTVWFIKNLEDNDVFYDIGAHLGFYTALAEEILTNGEIHAFEANRRLCNYLERNFFHSRNVHISCAAISDSLEDADFYDATETEDSSTSSRFNLSGLRVVPSRIAATTLDEYVKAGNKAPTVLKFDIEGGEYEGILGGLNLIKKHKPRIVMEVWAGDMGRKYSERAVKKLQELGYKAFLLQSDGSASKEPIDDPVGSILYSSNSDRDNFLFLMK